MIDVLRIWLIILLAWTAGMLRAQPSVEDYPYGLDPLLYNGQYYTHTFPPGTKGNPFFNDLDYVEGSVTIRGLTYDHLTLSYDLVNQLLILKFQPKEGGTKLIVPSNAWLESFDLGTKHFEIIPLPDTVKHIYQVIGHGDHRIAYEWTKTLDLDIQISIRNYVFSKQKRKTYLLTYPSLTRYTTNKSFIRLFPADQQEGLKRYITRNRIKVASASDEVMKQLIEFTNTDQAK